MNKRTVAFLAVAATLGAGGIGLVACSSDNKAGGLPSVGSDASTKDQSSGGGEDSGEQGDSAMPDDDSSTHDAGVDCGKPPRLHGEEAGTGPYCPFQDAGTGDASDNFTNCPANEHCCNPGKSASSFCAASCGFADGGTDFQCDTASQCPGANARCCLAGTVLTDNKCGAPYLFGSRVQGTTCRADQCQAGEVEICGGPTDCSTGTCTAFSTKGKDLGYCKQ